MRVRLLVLLIAIVAIPAVAQQRAVFKPGTKFFVPAPASVPDRKLNEYDRNRVVLAEFARCTLDRSPAVTQSVLSMPVSPSYYAALSKLASWECLEDGELRVAPSLLRGALFAELWRRRNAAEIKGASWGPVLPEFDPVEVSKTTDDYQAKQHAALMAFAQCVIARDRAAASDIVTTPVSSKAQLTAYAKLQASLGPCLNKGTSLKFSKPMLEGVLAEALYRSPGVAGMASPARSGNN